MSLRCHILSAWTWTVLVLDLLLLLTADDASAQRTVYFSEGADALLPCTYPEGRPPSKVSIYWKDKQDNQVLTILDYTVDPRNQSPEYRNRVRSFPDQYKDGNFSVVLMKVNGSDAGLFQCLIRPEGSQQNVRLNVTSKRGSRPSGSGVEGSGPLHSGSAASPHLLLLLLHLLMMLLFCL